MNGSESVAESATGAGSGLSFALWPKLRVPVYRQNEIAQCGPCCLAMVAGFYGLHLSNLDLHQVGRGNSVEGSRGMTMAALLDAARSLSLSGRGVRVDLAALTQLRCPAILHWDLNHFVVLESVKGRRVTLVDPAVGRRRMGMAELSRHFSGVALELQPAPGFTRQPKSPGLRLADLLRQSSGLAGQSARILVASMLVQFLLLLSPLYTQWVVDEALLSGDRPLLQTLALGFALLLLLQVLLGYLRDWLVVALGHGLAQRLGTLIADHLFMLPLSWFARRRSGDIFARFRALAPVNAFMTQGLPALVVDSTMTVIALALMLVYDWSLGLCVLATTALYFGYRWISFGAFRQRTMEQAVAAARQESQFLESLGGMSTVKSFGQESRRLQDWQTYFNNELNAGIRLARYGLSFDAVRGFVFGAQLLLVVYLAAQQVLAGTFTLGMLFAFLSYRTHFTTHVTGGIEQWMNYRALSVSLERLADIALAPTEDRVPGASGTLVSSTSPQVMGDAMPSHESVRANLSPLRLGDWHGELQLSQLQIVTADGGTDLFKVPHLAIGPGESVGLIGPSGCGKSSLLQTLMGLRPLVQGELWVGDQPLRGHQLSQYRRCLGVVQQVDHLFAGSLLDNLTLWQPVTPERLAQIDALLEMLDLRSCIHRLPMGLETPLGELGTGFSGGESQRLLLARALLREPKLLLLDEVTANLDPTSASLIQELVLGLPITRVLVTHDLAFAGRMDRCLRFTSKGLQEISPQSLN